jgi:WS/DGAT/MGAT family acyltransferase
MRADRLSTLETGYVTLEQSGAPIQVGSVGLLEAAPLLDARGAFRLDEVRARIDARVHLLPRLRQRLAQVPFDIARPEWVDEPDFDIADHVGVVSLWAPHDEQALRELAAELLMRPLDPTAPMWHFCFVTGLVGGRVALVERANHALVDGLSGVDLATILLDLERDAPVVDRPGWDPTDPPHPIEVLRRAVAEQARLPLEIGGSAIHALRHPGALLHQVQVLARAASRTEAEGAAAPHSSLNTPIGGRRRLMWVRQHLDEVKAAGHAHGATVNDVVLTAVAGGLRELLLARGEELPADLVLKVLVPVSLRAETERGSLGNRVGGLLLPLPVGIGDPAERLNRVATIEHELKEHSEAEASELLLAAADLLPAPLVPAAAALMDRQRLANLVVTNVPGPSVPLYAMGAELLEAFPAVPLAGNLTLGVAVLSYRNALNLGITADTRTCPDVDAFVHGLEHAFVELGAHWAPDRAVPHHLQPTG